MVQNAPAVVRTATLSGCDSVVFNSKRYKTSTIVRDTLKTTIGCDSVYNITNINVTTFRLSLTSSANPVFAGTTVFLSTNSNIAYQVIAWLPSHLFLSQTSSTQRLLADSARTIRVVAESNTGCIDTAQLVIEPKDYNDLFVPNAFSPNNDGKNDLFLVMGTTIDKGKVRIFNQWGEPLFATDDIRKGWDGTYKGRLQPVGVYVYEVLVTLRNGTEVKKKGFVNLIR
jgi:gliding motility-associated-like protein